MSLMTSPGSSPRASPEGHARWPSARCAAPGRRGRLPAQGSTSRIDPGDPEPTDLWTGVARRGESASDRHRRRPPHLEEFLVADQLQAGGWGPSHPAGDRADRDDDDHLFLPEATDQPTWLGLDPARDGHRCSLGHELLHIAARGPQIIPGRRELERSTEAKDSRSRPDHRPRSPHGGSRRPRRRSLRRCVAAPTTARTARTRPATSSPRWARVHDSVMARAAQAITAASSSRRSVARSVTTSLAGGVGSSTVADAGDLTQLIDRGEPPVLAAPVQNPLRQHRAHPGRPSRVARSAELSDTKAPTHRPAPPAAPPSRRTGCRRDDLTRSRCPDLLAVDDQTSLIEQRDIRPRCRTTGRRDRISNARPGRQAHQAGSPDLVYHPRPRSPWPLHLRCPDPRSRAILPPLPSKGCPVRPDRGPHQARARRTNRGRVMDGCPREPNAEDSDDSGDDQGPRRRRHAWTATMRPPQTTGHLHAHTTRGPVESWA